MNYRTAMKLSLLAIALTVCGSGQTTNASGKDDPVLATWRTGTIWWNGRFWRDLSEAEKNVFLFGYSNGVEFVAIASGGSLEGYKKLSKIFWPQTLTGAEVRASLDRFYETPENGPIGIPDAIRMIAKRSEGVGEEAIQKMITDLRAGASKN